MKQIAAWIANDGTEFHSQQQCIDYEHLCVEVESIMDALPKVEIRGEGYFQHNPGVVLNAQRQIVEIFERVRPGLKDYHTEWARNATVPAGMTLIGRYIDDAGPGPIRKAWWRFQKMDRKFREYEQPYYAIMADKGLPAESEK